MLNLAPATPTLTISSIVPCPPYASFDPFTGACVLGNQETSTSVRHSPALTTAQAIGIGIVIGAFIVAVIGTLLFFFLQKRRASGKNAIMVVTDGKNNNIELDKPYTTRIEPVEDPSGYYYE